MQDTAPVSDNWRPTNNLAAFELLFSIENVLREFITESLESLDGSRWYRRRLPGDILDSYKKGLEFEKAQVHVKFIPHHPVYYLDYPDIRKIIVKADNWRDAFAKTFVNKEHFQFAMMRTEPIRNKIAHNRVLSDDELKVIELVYAELKSYVGEVAFERLKTRTTKVESIGFSIRSLIEQAGYYYKCCQNYTLPDNLDSIEGWNNTKAAWWFDESYLGVDTGVVREFFDLIENYKKLPRYTGAGLEIKKWMKQVELTERFDSLNLTLELAIVENRLSD